VVISQVEGGYAQVKLLQSISRFERHLLGAVKLKKENISDYLVYNTLAMECFQAVNALIEIGEQLVVKNKLGVPSSYSEIFRLLKEGGIISPEEADAGRRLVFLRNLIAHEYHRIEEKELLEMVDLLERMGGFVERVKTGSLEL